MTESSAQVKKLILKWELGSIGTNDGVSCFISGRDLSRRGSCPNLAGYVDSIEDGERIVELFEDHADLVYSEDEPNNIQVNVSVDWPYLEALKALEALVKANGDLISTKIINRVKSYYSNTLSQSWYISETYNRGNIPCFVTGKMPNADEVFKTAKGLANTPESARAISSMFNGCAHLEPIGDTGVVDVQIAVKPEFSPLLDRLMNLMISNHNVITPQIIDQARREACLGLY